MKEEGFVSRCSVTQCIFNHDQRCRADSVQVAIHEDHADCETFTASQ